MLYHVSRNGQLYGPYSLDDLRNYVRSGNVLLTDLAKNDAMTDWLPVQQILGTVGVEGFTTGRPSTPGYAGGSPQQTAYPLTYPEINPEAYPDPPNLSWVLVLLFTILTCGLFIAIWNIIVAAWIKRIQPNSQGLLYYIAGVVILFLNSGFSYGVFFAFHHHHNYGHHTFASLLGIIGWGVRLVGLFMMKASLEEHYNGPEPLGMRLSGIMTFFFGGLYLSYHLNRVSEYKRALRFRGAAL
jgi:hypothetical protein